MNTTLHPARRVLVLGALVTGALLLSACGNRVLDYRNVEVVNGKIYSRGADKPFSGKVTNVPDYQVLNSQAGWAKMVQTSYNEAMIPSKYLPKAVIGLLCDARVDDGLLDGDVVCKPARSEIVRKTMSFKEGLLSGAYQFFSEDGQTVITSASFKKGQPDGTEKIYYAPNKQLVGEFPWSDGILDGTVKTYYGDSGNLHDKGRADNGKATGEWIRYAEDGKQVLQRNQYVDGMLDGVSEEYDPTHDITIRKTWAKGVLSLTAEDERSLKLQKDIGSCMYDLAALQKRQYGSLKKSEERELAEQCKQRLQAGNDSKADSSILSAMAGGSETANAYLASVNQNPSGGRVNSKNDNRNDWPTESNACTERWSAAFTKANGEDTLVSSQQAWDWVDQCRAGKEPH